MAMSEGGALLGNHASRDDATGNKLSGLPNVHLVEFSGYVIFIPQHARHISHQNELFCLEGGCNLHIAGSSMVLNDSSMSKRWQQQLLAVHTEIDAPRAFPVKLGGTL